MTFPPSHPPEPRAFALLNDEPVATEDLDLLGAAQAASQLTGLLLGSRHATPFTLAVDAGWGMGKSSLMRLVDARLRQDPDVRTVWYNAWTSTGADALEGLIKSVLAQVDPNILRRTLRRMRAGGVLGKAARALTLLVAGPLGVAGMVDELWKGLSVDATARNGMRDALRALVGEWTGAGPGVPPGRLLVVFIDDLDRCSEETVLAVCEAVKVYLDLPGLAFVVGCDRAAMGPGGLLRDLGPAGTAFMEKIFQTSYRIPVAGAPDIQEYVRACARHARLDHLLDDRLVELLAYRAAHNPRRVKRLVNGLLLEAALNPIWADLRTEAVIRTLLLQYLYPDFYRMMTGPGGPGPEDDVVQEFVEYRTVRGLLWSYESWPQSAADLADRFLRAHSVPPLSVEPGARGRALTALERRLPTGFPALADDPAFVSLVNELRALPEAGTVLRRLRVGVDGTEWGWARPEPGSAGTGRDRDPDQGVGEGWEPVSYPRPGLPTADPVRTRRGAGPRATAHPGPAVPGPGRPSDDPAAGRGSVPRSADGRTAQDPVAAEPRAARTAGPASPVTPALDEETVEPEFTIEYQPPAWYVAPSTRASRPERQRPHLVAVVGFLGDMAGRVVSGLRPAGVGPDQVFTELAWTETLALGPRVVLCHVHAFGERDKGFELIRAARGQGLTASVVFYAPRPTPHDERLAAELAATVADDTSSAVRLVLARLTDALRADPDPDPDPEPDRSGAGPGAGPGAGIGRRRRCGRRRLTAGRRPFADLTVHVRLLRAPLAGPGPGDRTGRRQRGPTTGRRAPRGRAGGLRTDRPASTPVRRPSAMTNRPSTSTYGMPVGSARGRSYVAPAATVSGSKSTRSARWPSRTRPRSGSRSRAAGRPVRWATHSWRLSTPNSRT